jgi:hypothetical protein
MPIHRKPVNRRRQATPPKAGEQKIAVGDGVELTGAEIRELLAHKAAAESARLAKPQSPADYLPELPSDFQLPPNVKYTFDPNNPALAAAREVAFSEGLSQAGFSKLLGIWAGQQVLSEQTVNTARLAEINKLGAAGLARFGAVETWLVAQLGDAGGKQMASRIFTASDVSLFEKLLAKATSQGGASYSASGREAPTPPGRLSDDDYNRLSPAAKLDHARKFDQTRMPPNPYDR